MNEVPDNIGQVVHFVLPLHQRIDFWLMPVALAVLMLAALLWWRRGGGRAFGWFAAACLLALAGWCARFLLSPLTDLSDPLALDAYARAARRVGLVNMTCILLAVLTAGAAAIELLRPPRPEATQAQPVDPRN